MDKIAQAAFSEDHGTSVAWMAPREENQDAPGDEEEEWEWEDTGKVSLMKYPFRPKLQRLGAGSLTVKRSKDHVQAQTQEHVAKQAHSSWNKLRGAVQTSVEVQHIAAQSFEANVRPPLVQRSFAEHEVLHSKPVLAGDAMFQEYLRMEAPTATVDKQPSRFLPEVVSVRKDASPSKLETMLGLTINAREFDVRVAQRRYASDSNDPHLPAVGPSTTEEEGTGPSTPDAAPALPDTWTCPVTGRVMWREERFEYLKWLPEFKQLWCTGFQRIQERMKRTHIQRRVLHVHRQGLCTFPEALCALIDTELDEVKAGRRPRNEQYRWEMHLAAETIAQELSPWLSYRGGNELARTAAGKRALGLEIGTLLDEQKGDQQPPAGDAQHLAATTTGDGDRGAAGAGVGV